MIKQDWKLTFNVNLMESLEVAPCDAKPSTRRQKGSRENNQALEVVNEIGQVMNTSGPLNSTCLWRPSFQDTRKSTEELWRTSHHRQLGRIAAGLTH